LATSSVIRKKEIRSIICVGIPFYLFLASCTLAFSILLLLRDNYEMLRNRKAVPRLLMHVVTKHHRVATNALFVKLLQL